MLRPESVSTKQARIAALARTTPARVFTSLNHFIDTEWLRYAYHLTRKDGAPGVDGQTAADYSADLEANLQSLLDRIKSGQYKAPPVRRVHIPKADGATRPLGIPTFEDKVAQRAFLLLLEPIYEADFRPHSYGFRPGRSAHQALRELRSQIMRCRLHWILDVDIRQYFDTIDHRWLRGFLDQRVTDGVVRRMIDKWLRAGICGITGNGRRIRWYAHAVQRIWHYWLAHRTRGNQNRWKRFERLLSSHPLPSPRIVHQYTDITASEPAARRTGCGKSARPGL